MQLPFSRPSQVSTGPRSGHDNDTRRNISNIFSGTSIFQRRREPSSPKDPTPRLGLRLLDSRRRTDTTPAMRSPTSTRSVIDPHSAPSNGVSFSPNSTSRSAEPQPAFSRTISNDSSNGHARATPSSRQNNLLDLAPRLGQLRRRHHRRLKSAKRRPTLAEAFRDKRVRSKAIQCIVLGFSLAIVLVIYLVVAVTNSSSDDQFHILLILIILILTIFFCHVFIRLCMMILSPPKPQDQIADGGSRGGALGYMNPATPIPVTFARDEELGEQNPQDDPAKAVLRPPPPAYGLWRGSVRIHPDLVHWQRTQTQESRSPIEQEPDRARPTTANRPPSYASDNGVDYVVDVEPRSFAPTEDMPIHPSERGRLGRLPEH
ncbi:MAG: hypothetical protein Q9227_000398 [Pyrenula ochraceoflavens]